MLKIRDEYTLVIDIGKTHVKLHVLDEAYQSVFAKQMTNKVVNDAPYPSADIDGIWQWLVTTITEVTPQYFVSRLTITTHGATAALINRDNNNGNGLVLPVLDYEVAQTYQNSAGYEEVRPEFSQSHSPSLPAGLNLGRQLFWLKENYSEAFDSASDILMYPQYWAWRFTGKCYSEITSLGCHTDLWSIADNDFSSLVDALDCRSKFPPIKPAWFNLGDVNPDLCLELGLPQGCQFYNGLHDSNASFLRYKLTQESKPFTVVSTGTWTILMASQVPLENLDPKKDMLANIDAFGEPIACARFMGGREFEAICEQAGSWLGEQFEQVDLQMIIEKGVFALPDFSEGSGPFGGRQSEIVGPVDQVSGIALATIYCALMIDQQLDSLAAKGNIFIEGAFLKNPLLCAVVNQLRSDQQVLLSLDATGTVVGTAYLTKWEKVESHIETTLANSTQLENLNEYKQKWLAQIS